MQAPNVPANPWQPYLTMYPNRITASYEELTSALPGIRLRYAVKCNPGQPVLSALKACGSGFEIAAIGELERLKAIGVDPATVLFSHTVRIPDHTQAAWEKGVRWFATDSVRQNAQLARLAPGSNIYVRINTNKAGGAVGSGGKFGVPDHDAIKLLLDGRDRGLIPAGITFHVGSHSLNPASYTSAIERCGAIMHILEQKHGLRLQMVDIGGGFPAEYPDDKVPPLDAYGQAILGAAKEHLPYDVQLVAEPGRRLVAAAGELTAQVIDVIDRDGTTWVHTTIGALNGLIEVLESGHRLRYPVRAKQPTSSTLRRCNITGPTCDSQDTVMYDAWLPNNLEPGDEIVFGQTGAYTLAYLDNFNDMPDPVTIYHK